MHQGDTFYSVRSEVLLNLFGFVSNVRWIFLPISFSFHVLGIWIFNCFCFDARYCDKVDSISHFQVTLVKDVLVKLLWQDYLFSSGSKHSEKIITRTSADSCENGLTSNKKTVETLNIMYPMSYLRELGNCIVGILSGIYLLKHDLLTAFCAEFQESCLGLFHNAGNLATESECAERLIQFISLLGEHAMQKGRSWPLVCLVGPMLAKSFPLMRSHVSCPLHNFSGD